MRRVASIACSLILVFGAAACGDDDDDEATTTSTTEPDSSTTDTTAAEPDTVSDEPVDGFDERSITFANLTYTVTDAHVTNQDLRSYAEGTEAEVGGTAHLVLDVEVENATGRQLESDGDAVGLEIDGETTGLVDDFLSDATGFIRSNESVEGFLAFEVDDGAPIEDAVLVLGIDPDRPARLPLTGDVPDDDFPVEATLSGTADGVGPTNGGTISFELLDVALHIDLPHGDATSPTGERADEGQIFLQVHVQATKTDGPGNDLLGDGAFRLLVDGTPRSPFDVATAPEGSAQTPTAEPNTTVDAWVLFAVDADAGEYVLQAGALDDSPGSLPLELPTP